MEVLLLAGAVRTKKEKQPRNFHLNVTVVYNLLVRRYTDAIKLTTAQLHIVFFFFFFFFLFFALNLFLSERGNFADFIL